MGSGKALSNLSYAFFTPEDLETASCETQKISNRMQTESPHLSNSDEVARDCVLPAPGPTSESSRKQAIMITFFFVNPVPGKYTTPWLSYKSPIHSISEGIFWGSKSKATLKDKGYNVVCFGFLKKSY